MKVLQKTIETKEQAVVDQPEESKVNKVAFA
jgi:hypothetical protein